MHQSAFTDIWQAWTSSNWAGLTTYTALHAKEKNQNKPPNQTKNATNPTNQPTQTLNNHTHTHKKPPTHTNQQQQTKKTKHHLTPKTYRGKKKFYLLLPSLAFLFKGGRSLQVWVSSQCSQREVRKEHHFHKDRVLLSPCAQTMNSVM